ncbi:Lrp/AsnC family transcriptional regulator [Actinomyces urinae]|uniref:Lrp/AsnC family transcriptional regulator n=1 Tax=Actinomyces urinae TaxID=1689268 RepID=UPI0009319C4E|nr:Lrp/AsnC family transcriptional regulator [Actinomyces urinae]
MSGEHSKDPEFELDETYLEILRYLRRDSRMSVAALAEAVGISRSNAYARLNTLVESGVIERFTVDINPSLIGKKVSAFVFRLTRASGSSSECSLVRCQSLTIMR